MPQPPTQTALSHSGAAWMLPWFIAWSVFVGGSNSTMAAPQDEPEVASKYLNLNTPTLGGKQLWTDHYWQQGWRIQQNVLTGHWRLLDPQNVRHAWGNRTACEQALRAKQLSPPPAASHMIIVLHGLFRSGSSMSGLQQHLSECLQLPIVNFGYASSRAAISSHAAALREVVAGLPAEVRLSFVGHSMGNIIVRHAIGDWQRANDQATLARLDAVVMLGPPNQGAAIARQLAKTGIFGWIAGAGGLELGPQWRDLRSQLGIPPCPFGIVAGNLADNTLQNPLLEGDSDLIVGVEETKLEGASDFLEVPVLHSFLMDDPKVQQAVAAFLKHHSFAVPQQAQVSGQ